MNGRLLPDSLTKTLGDPRTRGREQLHLSPSQHVKWDHRATSGLDAYDALHRSIRIGTMISSISPDSPITHHNKRQPQCFKPTQTTHLPTSKPLFPYYTPDLPQPLPNCPIITPTRTSPIKPTLAATTPTRTSPRRTIRRTTT